jgi:GxxExxY protein
VPFLRQLALPVEYKGVKVDFAYRLDVLVASQVVVEIKSVSAIEEIHKAQLLTYMRLGLLINFNVPILREGIRRMIL